jgi:hypothetical protein
MRAHNFAKPPISGADAAPKWPMNPEEVCLLRSSAARIASPDRLAELPEPAIQNERMVDEFQFASHAACRSTARCLAMAKSHWV